MRSLSFSLFLALSHFDTFIPFPFYSILQQCFHFVPKLRFCLSELRGFDNVCFNVSVWFFLLFLRFLISSELFAVSIRFLFVFIWLRFDSCFVYTSCLFIYHNCSVRVELLAMELLSSLLVNMKLKKIFSVIYIILKKKFHVKQK